MEKIRLEIVALSHSVAQSHNYAVVLGEQFGARRLPIVIGAFEAQAIAVAMERMAPNRPLTHDLFKNSLEKFEIDLKEIVINNLVEGVFYSLLICERHGETIEIDSRTSDAIAMAVRFQCPIFTSEDILEKAGVEIEDGAEGEETAESKSSKKRARSKPAPAKTATVRPDKLSSYSVKDLKSMMDEMLGNENYEKAAEIRDELERREKED
ncbi:MAG: bifunctional nuclease domain-containing protein [Saprospiraceae bacterium]